MARPTSPSSYPPPPALSRNSREPLGCNNTAREYFHWAMFLQNLILIVAAMMVGAAILLRSGNYKLLVWGSWILLILWPVDLVSLWFLYPNHRSYSLFFSSLLYNAQRYIFP